MLRAVCFDLWGTLVADAPGVAESRAAERVRRIDRALRDGAWPAPPEAITDAMQAAVDTVVGVHQDNIDIDAEERVALFYRHLDPSLRPEHDLPADAVAAVRAAIHESALYHPPELLAGAADTLVALQGSGCRLALVSNTGLSPGVALRSLLDALGIGRYFVAQVYSDELRSWKPDSRMFDEAVFALGVPKEQTLFVGDTAEADILGAQSYGIGLTAQVGGKRIEGIRPTLDLPAVGDLVLALRERGYLDAS